MSLQHTFLNFILIPNVHGTIQQCLLIPERRENHGLFPLTSCCFFLLAITLSAPPPPISTSTQSSPSRCFIHSQLPHPLESLTYSKVEGEEAVKVRAEEWTKQWVEEAAAVEGRESKAAADENGGSSHCCALKKALTARGNNLSRNNSCFNWMVHKLVKNGSLVQTSAIDT